MIENLDCIDILGDRTDGGVDLFIISSDRLDDSAETQTSLLDKVEHYLGYINSNEFKTDHPNANSQNTQIILQMTEEPAEIIKELIKKIAPWVEEYNALFSVQVKS